MSVRARAGALPFVVLLLAPLPAAEPADSEPRARGGGRLIWDASDELDLLGDLWVELPFRVGRSGELFLRLDTRVTICQARDFTFAVRDFQYDVELGARDRFTSTPRHRYALLAGQRGVERVDAPGQPYYRYVAWELSGGDVRTPRDPRGPGGQRADWTVASGPVLEEREVRADFMLRGAARIWLMRSTSRPAVSLDVALDGQLDGTHLDSDLRGGPSVSFFLSSGSSGSSSSSGGPVATFSLHYQRSRNPLGIGHSAWLLGFQYAGTGGSPRAAAPRIEGSLGAGGGDDGRLAGQLRLRFVSPGFARRWQAAILVDANVLTARDTGDLFYRYDVGIERRSRSHRRGLYFHHRSNHVLAEPSDGVTSVNVLEIGGESESWGRSGRRSTRRWGVLEGRARAGYLLDSDFGEERRWHLRGGLRFSLPAPVRLQPFARVEVEAGDVSGELYGIGLAVGRAWDFELAYRDDGQSFSRDPTALLLAARYGF